MMQLALDAGFAGVFGYAWVATLHVWARVSFRHTLLAANASSILWLIIYYSLLDQPQVCDGHE